MYVRVTAGGVTPIDVVPEGVESEEPSLREIGVVGHVFREALGAPEGKGCACIVDDERVGRGGLHRVRADVGDVRGDEFQLECRAAGHWQRERDGVDRQLGRAGGGGVGGAVGGVVKRDLEADGCPSPERADQPEVHPVDGEGAGRARQEGHAEVRGIRGGRADRSAAIPRGVGPQVGHGLRLGCAGDAAQGDCGHAPSTAVIVGKGGLHRGADGAVNKLMFLDETSHSQPCSLLP